MKLTFEETQEVKIEESDRAALQRLAHNRDFKKLQSVVEDYALKLTHNLAIGTAISKEARHEEMDKLAGFVYYWNKIIALIESK